MRRLVAQTLASLLGAFRLFDERGVGEVGMEDIDLVFAAADRHLQMEEVDELHRLFTRSGEVVGGGVRFHHFIATLAPPLVVVGDSPPPEQLMEGGDPPPPVPLVVGRDSTPTNQMGWKEPASVLPLDGAQLELARNAFSAFASWEAGEEGEGTREQTVAEDEVATIPTSPRHLHPAITTLMRSLR